MRVCKSLEKLFEGFTANIKSIQGESVENASIQFGYGDVKELNRWIDLKNANNQTKYPLLWYVIQEFKVDKDWLEVENGGLVVFAKTKINLFNQQRAEDTYENILYPVWEATEKRLRLSSYFDFIYNGGIKNRFRLDPQPLYGVDIKKEMQEYKSTDKTGEEGILLDVNDALFSNFNFRINYKCI